MSYTRLKSVRKKRRGGTSKLPGSERRRSSGDTSGDCSPDEVDLRFTPSSGNVFLDLGFAPEEAGELLARADLMTQMSKLIDRLELTQARAAKLFGVTQPRISDLVRGKIDLFSVDGLLAMLGHAGMKVTIQIKSAA